MNTKFDNFNREITTWRELIKMAIGPIIFMVLFFGFLTTNLWLPDFFAFLEN